MAVGGVCKERLDEHVRVPWSQYGGGQDYGQEGMALRGWGVKIKLQMDLGRGVVE